eukprot:3861838-Pyramimonas_sp.AAC.1
MAAKTAQESARCFVRHLGSSVDPAQPHIYVHAQAGGAAQVHWSRECSASARTHSSLWYSA